MRRHKFEDKEMSSFWNRQGKDQFTAINKASSREGCLEIVEYILSFQGIDLTIGGRINAWLHTPLHNACLYKKWIIVESLMAYPYMSKAEKKKYVSLRGCEIFEKMAMGVPKRVGIAQKLKQLTRAFFSKVSLSLFKI